MKLQIYQLKYDNKYHSARFQSLKETKEMGFKLNQSDYELKYAAEIDGETNTPIQIILDKIFTCFNLNKPKDFFGHSLSVSDVIVLTKENKATAYYVEPLGYTEMPEFFKKMKNTDE